MREKIKDLGEAKNLIWLINKIKKRIPALILMTLVNIGIAYALVQFAVTTQQVIDSATEGVILQFRTACVQLLICVISIALGGLIMTHMMERTMALLDMDWKKNITHSLLQSDYAQVSAYHSGELINRLNNDVRTVDTGLVSIMPNLMSMLTRVVAATYMLSKMDLTFTFVIVCAGLLMIIFTGVLRNKLKYLHKRVSEENGRVSGFIQEMLEKILMVQALDVCAEMERREGKMLAERWRWQRVRKNISMISSLGTNLVGNGAEVLAIIWCAVRLLNGQITFGMLTAIVQLVEQLKGPIVNFSGFIPQYIAMMASVERLRELEYLKVEEKEPIDGSELYSSMLEIQSENLQFSYGENEKILRFSDFAITKDSLVAVIGPSGIGKSTLLKLMLGIYKSSGGNIFIKTQHGRIPLSRATRRLFAYVPQGNLLLSGTLRENLLLTNPEADDAAIKEALYVSNLEEWISQLPQQLDTVIGENAVGISEGQAQRISIARAVLSEAPILLLDEATSALDAETEKMVLERLTALSGHTCIAVTHRPAAIELADICISIEEIG